MLGPQKAQKKSDQRKLIGNKIFIRVREFQILHQKIF